MTSNRHIGRAALVPAHFGIRSKSARFIFLNSPRQGIGTKWTSSKSVIRFVLVGGELVTKSNV